MDAIADAVDEEEPLEKEFAAEFIMFEVEA